MDSFLLARDAGDGQVIDLAVTRVAPERAKIPARMSLDDVMREAEAARLRNEERDRQDTLHLQRILGGVVGYAREPDPNGFPTYPPYYVRQPYPPPRYELDYVAAATQVPMVYACITRIAQDMAGLPTRFYRGDGTKRQEIEAKPGTLPYLWSRPNPVDSAFTLNRDWVVSFLTTGNSGIFIDTFGSDPFAPTPLWELWAMPGHVLKVCVDERRRPVAYEWLGGIAPILLDAKQVVYAKNLNVNFEPRGMSPLEAVRIPYQTRWQMGLWNHEFYAKGAQVAGLWSADVGEGRTLDEHEIRRMKEQLRKLNSGIKWAWDPVIVQNLKHERAGLTHQEMGYGDTLTWTDSDICRAFGIPPVVMGIKEGGGLSDAGAKADLMLYYENCLVPLARLLDSLLTRQLCNRWGDDIYAETDFSGVMALQTEKLEQMKSAVVGAGRPPFDVNEVRKIMGHGEREDAGEKADELFMPPTQDIGTLASTDKRPPASQGGTADEKPAKRAAADGPDPERREQAKRATVRRRGMALITSHQRRFEREVVRIMTGQQHRVEDRARSEFELRGLTTARAKKDAKKPAKPEATPTPVDAEAMAAAIGADDLYDVEAIEALFAKMVAERGADQVAEFGIEYEIDLLNARAQRWIQESAHRVLDQINDTSGRTLREALGETIRDGGNFGDVLTTIREVFDQRKANAGTIARTETTGAFNYANLNAAKAAGVATHKMWVTAEDEHVREAHTHAEETGEIPIDGTWLLLSSDGAEYEVGYPGDPGAPADQRCNCRCVLAFKLNEDKLTEAKMRRVATKAMRDWFAEAKG